jgi:hypothetical protein
MRTYIEDRAESYRRPWSVRPAMAMVSIAVTIAVGFWFGTMALREGGLMTWAGHERIEASSGHVIPVDGPSWNVTSPMVLNKGDVLVGDYRALIDRGSVVIALYRGNLTSNTSIEGMRRIGESDRGEVRFEIHTSGLYRVETRGANAAGAALSADCAARSAEALNAGIALPPANCQDYDVRANVTWRIERAQNNTPAWKRLVAWVQSFF